MYETTTSARIRQGITQARHERAEAARKAFRWLTFRH
jgi:hypothetical protein